MRWKACFTAHVCSGGRGDIGRGSCVQFFGLSPAALSFDQLHTREANRSGIVDLGAPVGANPRWGWLPPVAVALSVCSVSVGSFSFIMLDLGGLTSLVHGSAEPDGTSTESMIVPRNLRSDSYRRVFSFLFPHRRHQNMDPKTHTRYLVVIVYKRLGKKNYVGSDILRTQRCNQDVSWQNLNTEIETLRGIQRMIEYKTS